MAAVDNIFSVYGTKYLTYVLLQAVGVYFNLYFLIPRLLERGKILTYLSSVAATVLTVAAIIPLGYYFTAWASGRDFQQLFNHDPNDYYGIIVHMSLKSTVASMTLGMSIKLAKNWLEAREKQRVLEKENLTTELKFLKSQFNPHFLFNTINSIFVLIHKNPDMASESLAKFSNLLRYQLYECNDNFIPLDQEISFLENFFELESLRQNSNQLVDINITLPQNRNLAIAPFLLIPFLENAFKHVNHEEGKMNRISVNLWLEAEEFHLQVCNTKSRTSTMGKDLVSGGIGLKNVQRRLELLYPKRHELNIQNGEDRFTVDLSIRLSALPLQSLQSASNSTALSLT
jgi:sensor histidine kinase YesM